MSTLKVTSTGLGGGGGQDPSVSQVPKHNFKVVSEIITGKYLSSYAAAPHGNPAKFSFFAQSPPSLGLLSKI